LLAVGIKGGSGIFIPLFTHTQTKQTNKYMKISKLFVTSAVAAAASLASLQAGVAPAPAPMAPAPSHSLLGDVTGELSAGYDSHYIFRGSNLGQDAVWTGLDLSVPLMEGVGLGLGAWYINPTDGGALNDDELDLYASLGTSLGMVDVSVGYTAYLYPEAGGDYTNEINVALGTELAGVAIGGLYAYDFDLENHYFELSLGYGVAITESISADASVRVGFIEEDYTHTTVSLGFPIALTGNATLTPYIAGVWPEEDSRISAGGEDEVFGGASLSVSF